MSTGSAYNRYLLTSLQIVALLLLVTLAYSPVRHAGFVWDDESAVINNPLLRNGDGLHQVWTTVGLIPDETHWWPLTYTALWGEAQLWGLNPLGFHIVNVVLHALLCVLIFAIARRLSLPGAWWAAALFAVHPVHVEAVAWVIGIKDVLATLFYGLAVACFLHYDDRRRPFWFATTLLMAALAMLAKSIAVTLPAGLAILIWYRRGRIEWRDMPVLASVAVVTLGLGIIDTLVLHQMPQLVATVPPPLIERGLHAVKAVWFYAGKLIWPVPLSIIYPAWKLTLADVNAWLAFAGIVGAIAALWLGRSRWQRGPLACALFYGVTLSPVLGIIHFPFLEMSPGADRYQYLASAGILLGMGGLIGRCTESRHGLARVVFLVGTAALLLLAGLTGRHADVFRTQTGVFAHARKVAPHSWVVLSNLGSGLKAEGKNEQALEAFQGAIAQNPKDRASLANAALILMNTGRPAEAEELLVRTLQIDPDYSAALTNLGVLLLRQNRLVEAREIWTRKLRVQPDDLKAMANLAYACGALGDVRAQEALYRRALELAPNRHDLLNNLALIVILTSTDANSGPQEAIVLAESAVKLAPDNVVARYLNTLGMAYAAAGKNEDAVAAVRMALEVAQKSGPSQEVARSEELLRKLGQVLQK